MKKKFAILLFFVLLITISMLCSCSSCSNSSYYDNEVENLKNELYYKGSDGKWYLK